MRDDIEKMLDECIDRMNAGESLEDCLVSYPDRAEELRPLLTAAFGIRDACSPIPGPGAKALARSKLQAALAEKRMKAGIMRRIFEALSIQKKKVVATVSIILIVAIVGLSVGLLVNTGGGSHISSDLIGNVMGEFSSNSTTSLSVNGLNLSLSLNSTTFHPGQEVSIVIDEQNTLPVAYNVSSSQNWPLSELSLGSCGTLNYPLGVAIFQGYYSSANVSTATPLVIYNPSPIPCPAMFPITAYVFQPSSDIAAIFGGCGPNPCYTTEINAEVNVTGYWTGSWEAATLTNFTPGVYTVVAGDEWGALAVLHFVVSK